MTKTGHDTAWSANDEYQFINRLGTDAQGQPADPYRALLLVRGYRSALDRRMYASFSITEAKRLADSRIQTLEKKIEQAKRRFLGLKT